MAKKILEVLKWSSAKQFYTGTAPDGCWKTCEGEYSRRIVPEVPAKIRWRFLEGIDRSSIAGGPNEVTWTMSYYKVDDENDDVKDLDAILEDSIEDYAVRYLHPEASGYQAGLIYYNGRLVRGIDLNGVEDYAVSEVVCERIYEKYSEWGIEDPRNGEWRLKVYAGSFDKEKLESNTIRGVEDVINREEWELNEGEHYVLYDIRLDGAELFDRLDYLNSGDE